MTPAHGHVMCMCALRAGNKIKYAKYLILVVPWAYYAVLSWPGIRAPMIHTCSNNQPPKLPWSSSTVSHTHAVTRNAREGSPGVTGPFNVANIESPNTDCWQLLLILFLCSPYPRNRSVRVRSVRNCPEKIAHGSFQTPFVGQSAVVLGGAVCLRWQPTTVLWQLRPPCPPTV